MTLSTILQKYVPIDPNTTIASNYDTYVNKYNTLKNDYYTNNSNNSNVDLNYIKTETYKCFTYFRTLKQQIDTYERFSISISMIQAKIEKLTNTEINKINIKDNEKIIQNCDPYSGIVKTKRVNKFFSCFNGQSPNLIEFGIPIINSIVQKIPDTLKDIRNKFINTMNSNIINALVAYVQQESVDELFRGKLRNALNRLNEIKDINDNDVFTTMLGGKSGGRNIYHQNHSPSSSSYPTSLTSSSSDSTSLTLKSASPSKSMTQNLKQQKSNTYDRKNYEQIKENRTKYLNSIDEEFNKILKQLENTERNESFKAVITHMKDHISEYGRKFIDTLDEPYSMDHLHADREIHKPFFTLSLFKTFAQITQEIENTNHRKQRVKVIIRKKVGK